MQIALFDWNMGGHHARYIRQFSQVLSGIAKVVVALPDEISSAVENLPVEVFSLGSARPDLDLTQPLGPQHKQLANIELDLFERFAKQVRPDHLVHLCADPIIRRLVERPALPCATSLLLFRPRAHFASAYHSSLPNMEKLRAWFLEFLIMRWKRRPDAHALLTLDEEATKWWTKRLGVRSFWVPEPPIELHSQLHLRRQRQGCILYGSLAPRKGIDLLAQALGSEKTDVKVVIAGSVEHGFEDGLQDYVSMMRKAGAQVELRAHQHSELEGLTALSEARCAVLPYPRHYGMSRVIVEAASVGTPVVAHDYGMLGYLVRRHRLGVTVNCNNPEDLRRTVLSLCDDAGAVERYADSLSRFAKQFSAAVFQKAIIAPFAMSDTSVTAQSKNTINQNQVGSTAQ